MDTPKRHISWVESFPPDIWAYFASYIDGEHLGRLKMTGATILWQRLTSPSVVKSIKLGQDYMIFKSLPSFLNDFPSLEVVSISSRNHQWSQDLGLTINLIPSGLRKLKLSGNWNQPADALFGEDGATLKLDEHLPHLEYLDLNQLSFTSYSWLSHSPQSLTSLKIQRWDGTVELPTSLIHLTADIIGVSANSFVSKLPPGLESLVVRYGLTGAELLLPLLPPSLRELDFGECLLDLPYFDDSSPNLLEQLPKFLTRLTVPYRGVDFEDDPERTRLFPSTLTALDIRDPFPSSAWALLPPSLTSLHFIPTESLGRHDPDAFEYGEDNEDNEDFGDDEDEFLKALPIPFETLPRSITSLQQTIREEEDSCFFYVPNNCLPDSYFPPGLTYLSLQAQLSPEAAALLPPSLTHLEIGNFCERVCQHLPRDLKTLIAGEILMTPNLTQFLPPSLTFLRLSYTSAGLNWLDYKTGQIANSVLERPEYSVHEKCTSEGFDWKGTSPLPRTLTFFEISNAFELGDSFMLHQQLPNLTELNFQESKHFTDLSFPLPSPHLKVLDLSHSARISGKSFEFLPKCLTSLNLNHSESIFDSDIQHLPRTLKQAYLRDAIHLTDSCIRDLPPHLEKLVLSSNKKITPSSFPHLPYALRSSQQKSYASIGYSLREKPAKFSTWEVFQGQVHVKLRAEHPVL